MFAKNALRPRSVVREDNINAQDAGAPSFAKNALRRRSVVRDDTTNAQDADAPLFAKIAPRRSVVRDRNMSGEGFPFALPFSRFAASAREGATLFEELRSPLLRYLVSLGLSADEAQDVVQDAFLSLHRSLAAGGSPENVRAWLFRVAHNSARNRQRSYHRRFGGPLENAAFQLPDGSTPERAVLKKEQYRKLGAAIRSLSDIERECLLLRAEGLRYREIGEVLGLATSTVGSIVDRAVKKLAEQCNV